MALWQEKKNNVVSTVVVLYLLVGFLIGLNGVVGTWITDGATADRVNWAATFGNLFWMTVGWPVVYVG